MRVFGKIVCLLLAVTLSAGSVLSGCSDGRNEQQISQQVSEIIQEQTEYISKPYSINRNGIELHLDCLTVKNVKPEKIS